MLAPFAAGYFLSYMFRAINAVVAPNLASELDLDAGQLGLVTAAYLIAFALFQLPLGMLLDRYGPRRVQTVLLTTAAIGATAFAMAESALGLALARALIGLGFAGGLMAGFKAVVIWFAPARHALANASIMSVGGLGMLAATLPAEYAVQTIGWRGLFYVSAGVTAAVAIGIYFIVPEREVSAGPHRSSSSSRISNSSTRIGFFGESRRSWHSPQGRMLASTRCGLAPGSGTSAGSTGMVSHFTCWLSPLRSWSEP